MRSILVVTMTTGSSSGTAPPASPVPEPRATNGRPCRRAARTQACTSAVVEREADDGGPTGHVRGVALVERELERLGANAIGAESSPQVLDERRHGP